MDGHLHLKIHHGGEFVDEEHTVYEGGEVADLKIDVDMWSYFELLGCFKDLLYNAIEKTCYRDPTFGMNVLVDDNGALDIAYLYRVHLSVDIYIQHTLSHPEYYDGPFDKIVNKHLLKLLNKHLLMHPNKHHNKHPNNLLK
ncbi:unnamed protein product [Lathyrus oleraceus]